MKHKSIITLLIILCAVTLTACEGKTPQSRGEMADNGNSPAIEATDNNELPYDLKDPIVLKNFIEYFDMDKTSLADRLTEAYGESPVEETDLATGTTLLKLEKTGLIFHLTDEEGVPVSHVDIVAESPFHYGGARINMSFSEIMNLVGETLITADPFSENEEQKQYQITYPLDGVSVVFTSGQVFENSSKMMLNSWGYYDVEPTLLSAKEICTSYGVFTIPASWVGKIALEDSGSKQVISYLNPHGSYPLIEIESFNLTDWNGLNSVEQDNYQIISKTEDWIFAVKRLSENPSNKEDAKLYQSMQADVDDLLNTFELNGQTNVSDHTSAFCNDEYISQSARTGQISKLFEKFFLENWKDQSETGADEAYSEFGKCFAEKVDAIAINDNSLNNVVKKLRTNIQTINDDWHEYQYYLNGGGTMWSHMSVRQASMIDAVIYGYFVQLDSSEGQTENANEFNKLLDQLSISREYISQNPGVAANDEDQASLEAASNRLVTSYDGIISVLKEMTPNQAAVELLKFIAYYQAEE